MLITIKVTTDIENCTQCPLFTNSMDGPFCMELEKQLGPYQGLVFPEGRTEIHPLCPFKE